MKDKIFELSNILILNGNGLLIDYRKKWIFTLDTPKCDMKIWRKKIFHILSWIWSRSPAHVLCVALSISVNQFRFCFCLNTTIHPKEYSICVPLLIRFKSIWQTLISLRYDGRLIFRFFPLSLWMIHSCNLWLWWWWCVHFHN